VNGISRKPLFKWKLTCFKKPPKRHSLSTYFSNLLTLVASGTRNKKQTFKMMMMLLIQNNNYQLTHVAWKPYLGQPSAQLIEFKKHLFLCKTSEYKMACNLRPNFFFISVLLLLLKALIFIVVVNLKLLSVLYFSHFFFYSFCLFVALFLMLCM